MVITTILGVSFHNTYASGIPVVDGALNGLMKFETIKAQEHRLATIAQWAKDVTHYASVIQNWKDNFKNQIRNQLMEMLGINLKAGTINKEEVLNLSPLEKRRQAVEKEQQEKLQTAEQQQSAVQRINEPEKGRTVASVQDKVSANESNIKKPRKVLLRIESKGNVRSQEHERERSL